MPYVPRDYEATMGVGFFDAWLEGTSFSSPASGSHGACLFKILYDGNPGTFTVAQAGGPLSVGAGNGLGWNQTVASNNSTYRFLEYRAEDASMFNAGPATWSVLASCESGTVNATMGIVQFFGTGGTPSADVVVGTKSITITPTWQRFIFTVDMPSTASKLFGSAFNDCVKLQFYLPAQGTFNVAFSEWRFERGSMSPISYVPLALKHTHLNRYLQYSKNSLTFPATAQGQYCFGVIPFKLLMRATPTVTFASAGGQRANLYASAPENGAPAATGMTNFGGSWYIKSEAAGQCSAIDEYIKLDARL